MKNIILASSAIVMSIELVSHKASDNTGCVQALSSDPRTSTASNLTALANICLDLAVANSTNSLGFVKKMDQEPSTSPDLKSVLDSCVKNYDFAVQSFQSAISDLKSDMSTAILDIKTAIDGPQSCRDELSKHSLSVPEISKRNRYIHLYSNIGDVITRTILDPIPSRQYRLRGSPVALHM
ncbi:hypothetical protein CRG98_021538 [Punica granatum]|uniref:Pectinesterase inhibitor domain-containing protein n=1 Tax=Punica granatum TaxID=22663 RepID=A0A2I0JP18_PUNGR|nr:hypothetical protein CRG98_021538 [Punica granatum]